MAHGIPYAGRPLLYTLRTARGVGSHLPVCGWKVETYRTWRLVRTPSTVWAAMFYFLGTLPGPTFEVAPGNIPQPETLRRDDYNAKDRRRGIGGKTHNHSKSQ